MEYQRAVPQTATTVGQCKPRHIGLNAHLLSLSETYRTAGINRTIHNLLLHIPQANGHNRYTAFLSERRMVGQTPPSLRLHLSRLPTVKPPVRIFWEQVVQPIEVQRAGIDVLHSLAFVKPFLCPCPSVVTIYDLSFLRFPQSFKPLNRLYLSTFTRWSAARAERIITISRCTKQDVCRFLNVPDDKVDVIFCGVEDTFHPRAQDEVDAFRVREGLPERMILCVSSLEPRKNLGRLLRAFAQARGQLATGHKLVLAGAPGWGFQPIFDLVEQLGLGEDVLFPGFIPQDELPLWYSAADLFVYPSLYEGFGLPPLEAMACGVPVIVSNSSSLPEVVGEAGILVDPYDVDALAAAIVRVLRNRVLAEAMREAGLARARQFTWERAAKAIVQVYEGISGGQTNPRTPGCVERG